MGGKVKSVIVTISDEGLKHIEELAKELTSKGMKVDRVLPLTGVVSGSITPSKLSGLSKLTGVLSVEEEQVAELSSESES